MIAITTADLPAEKMKANKMVMSLTILDPISTIVYRQYLSLKEHPIPNAQSYIPNLGQLVGLGSTQSPFQYYPA